MTNLRFLVVAILALLAAGCSVSKHVQEKANSIEQTSSGSSTQSNLLIIDSLFRHFTLDADSITVSVTMPQSGVASSCQDTSKTEISWRDEALTPSIRVTAHRPHVVSEERRGSNTQAVTLANDSTKSVEETHTERQTDKDVVGVAKPMNGTAVTITIVLGVLLLLIGGVILILWLHKKGII